ncbi:MAG: ribonuclease HII [Deltaproteobacteria bacterium]|nr:ribonuclease HII [Deltaproteobacteria bacterium]
MDSFERDAFDRGNRFVAGVDEAGRGPLAGPVVAGAVVFEFPPPIGLGIRDSKKLTPSRRASLVLDIYRTAVAVGVGIVWPGDVDRLNIHRASLLAMEKAVRGLGPPDGGFKPDFILIDGAFRTSLDIPQLPVVSGDSLSVSIAAASIIAKTARDAIMEAYHRIYPHYGFPGNKGYPTKGHRAALSTFGPCPIHRKSFRLSLKQD